MKTKRNILFPIYAWLTIFIAYLVIVYPLMSYGLIDRPEFVLGICIIPTYFIWTSFYYREKTKIKGIVFALKSALIAVFLDGIITVPLFEIPEGNSYGDFYGNPLFWILILEIIVVVFVTSIFKRKRVLNK